MAVSIAYYSVLVRNATITSRFPGGVTAYERACPNESWCTDGRINRVGFMAFADVEAFVRFLEGSGVPFAEIAVTRQERGLIVPCDWLDTGVFEGRPIAWLAGTEPETAYIPECDMESSLAAVLTQGELKAKYENLGVVDGVETIRHRTTGEKMFIGHPTPPRAPGKRWWWPFRK